MRRIAIINQKGGVEATRIVVNDRGRAQVVPSEAAILS